MKEVFDDRIGQFLKDSGYELCDFINMPVKVKPGEIQQEVPKQGIVTFKLTNRRRQTHDNRQAYHAYYDSKSRVVYGEPLGFGVSTTRKSIKWKEIFIAGELILDLSNESERRQYYILIHSEILQGGVNATSGACLQLVNPEADARKRNETRKTAIEADKLITMLEGEELVDFGMLFKINPRNTHAVIKDELYKISANTPGEIIKRHEDPDRKIWTILRGGVANGVLVKTQQGILYGGVNLGLSEDVAIEFLKNNRNQLSGISQAVDYALKRTIVPLSVKQKDETESSSPGLTKTS